MRNAKWNSGCDNVFSYLASTHLSGRSIPENSCEVSPPPYWQINNRPIQPRRPTVRSRTFHPSWPLAMPIPAQCTLTFGLIRPGSRASLSCLRGRHVHSHPGPKSACRTQQSQQHQQVTHTSPRSATRTCTSPPPWPSRRQKPEAGPNRRLPARPEAARSVHPPCSPCSCTGPGPWR